MTETCGREYGQDALPRRTTKTWPRKRDVAEMQLNGCHETVQKRPSNGLVSIGQTKTTERAKQPADRAGGWRQPPDRRREEAKRRQTRRNEEEEEEAEEEKNAQEEKKEEKEETEGNEEREEGYEEKISET